MKVAVFGATGGTGSLVVRKLVEQGHEAIAVSRKPAAFAGLEKPVESRTGDLFDQKFVKAALADCDAAIICLGINRKSKNLWSGAASPLNLMSSVVGAVVGAIGDDASKRLLYLSAFGVGEEHKHAMLFRFVLRTTSISSAYADHARAEQIIRSSALNWTIVRPPGLNDKEEEVELVDRGDRWSSFDSASRKSVAKFFDDALENTALTRKTVTIGAKAG